MTKPLDPEIKSLRAVDRALSPLGRGAQNRIINWLASRWTGQLIRIESKGLPVNLTEGEIRILLRLRDQSPGVRFDREQRNLDRARAKLHGALEDMAPTPTEGREVRNG